jgi:hypothetical protein
MKILVSFSGGFDSTYIMYKLLKETDHEITAVCFYGYHKDLCISVQPTLSRIQPNLDIIVQELKKIRDFTFITKEIQRDEFNENDDLLSRYIIKDKMHPISSGPLDYFIWWSIPGVNAGLYDTLVHGISWEQMRKKYKTSDGTEGSPKHVEAENKLKRYAPTARMWLPLLNHDFHHQFNRWHIFKYMPQILQRYCISCASPVENAETKVKEPCDFCFKCLWDRFTKNIVEHDVMTAEQLEEYRYKKALEYGGGNGITATMRYWLPVEMRSEKAYYRVDDMKLDSKEKVQQYMQNKNFDYLVK